jgi:uncharacterized protein involved in exopolysaccharide biosynthesis
LWLSIVAVVVLITIGVALFSPRQYQSQMSILLENSRGSYQITPQRETGAVEMSGVTEEQINSEIEVLGSRNLADQVVDPNWNDQSAQALPVAQLKAHERAVADFRKHLSIALVRKSNVINVVYTASDPKVANQTLNRLLNVFLAKQKEIGHPPGTSQFFASEAARYKKQLDDAQQQLAQYQQQHQIVSLPDTESELDKEIQDAQSQLRSTDVQISEMSQRINSQIKQLATIPQRQSTQVRSIPNDYSVERLNTLLADLQNQRTALLTKFTPNDRMVQQIDKQIADTKEAMKSAQQMRSEEHSSDVNPIWEQVNSSIVHNESERQALNAQHTQLTEQIAKLQGSLSSVEGSTVDYTTLRQKVQELETNYQTYAQKRDDALTADAMDQSRLLNVAVAQAPTFAISPSSPKRGLDLALGTLTAVFLACFAVFFSEMGRTSIATPRELDLASRYPLLATIPFTSEGGENPMLQFNRAARFPTTLQREASLKPEEHSVEEQERQVQAS